MTPLVFIDTETTSLRPDRRAWEIGLIVRGQDDVEHHWFVDVADLDLGGADLRSLQIGRFHDRHPQVGPASVDNHMRISDEFGVRIEPRLGHEEGVLRKVEALTRGAHLVGAVPNFDADVLDRRMRAHGICPSWHYHLIDVETLAVGYLAGKFGPDDFAPTLPWDSEYLSRACQVKPPSDADRHTALGDARWARDLYDAVMRGGAR